MNKKIRARRNKIDSTLFNKKKYYRNSRTTYNGIDRIFKYL